jgi:hypothetical protein
MLLELRDANSTDRLEPYSVRCQLITVSYASATAPREKVPDHFGLLHLARLANGNARNETEASLAYRLHNMN